MVVVHDPSHAIGWLLADRAHAVLGIEEGVELQRRQALTLARR
jgi:hypothetical protein